MAHDHNHDHGHSHGKGAPVKVLMIAIILAFTFAMVEAIFGWMANSLALLSDAGHMAADALSLILAAVAAWIAVKPPSPKHTYGLGRAEVLGAWISSIFIMLVIIGIVFEAIERFSHPENVSGLTVIGVALTGVIINCLIAWVLTHGERTLNIRAAILHVIGDLLGSAAALISGIVIYFTHWMLIDPLLSVFIGILILISSIRLLKESMRILMEGVPMHLDYNEIGQRMAEIAKVKRVHDLHIWTLSSGSIALSAHIEVDELELWNDILADLQTMLAEKFHIEHITLQPEEHSDLIHPAGLLCK